jgi:hypothetical protein
VWRLSKETYVCLLLTEYCSLTTVIYYACDIPEDLTYDVEHDVWIRFEGDCAVLGMTDVAQTRCGKIAAISFRKKDPAG